MEDSEDLRDRIDWMTTTLALRASKADDEALPALFGRLALLQQRLAKRSRSPFQTLSKRLALSDTEQHVVLLLATMRGPTDLQMQIRQHAMASELTLDAIRTLIYGASTSLAAYEELASDGTLRRLAIMERNDDHGSNTHESKQTWAIAPRVLAMLHGRDSVDSTLARIVKHREEIALTDIATAPEALRVARSAMTSDAVVVASAMPGLGRRSLLTAAACEVGRELLEVDGRRFAKEQTTLVAQLRAIARECRLLGRLPLIGNLDALDEERIALVGSELVALVEGPVLATMVCSGPGWTGIGR